MGSACLFRMLLSADFVEGAQEEVEAGIFGVERRQEALELIVGANLAAVAIVNAPAVEVIAVLGGVGSQLMMCSSCALLLDAACGLLWALTPGRSILVCRDAVCAAMLDT